MNVRIASETHWWVEFETRDAPQHDDEDADLSIYEDETLYARVADEGVGKIAFFYEDKSQMRARDYSIAMRLDTLTEAANKILNWPPGGNEGPPIVDIPNEAGHLKLYRHSQRVVYTTNCGQRYPFLMATFRQLIDALNTIEA